MCGVFASFSILLRPPRSLLFPYTTLFRSDEDGMRRQRLEPLCIAQRLAGELLLVDRFALSHQRFGLHAELDRKSTRLNSSHVKISYAVFCLKKKTSARLTASAASSPRYGA